jgi:hypothetical protein
VRPRQAPDEALAVGGSTPGLDQMREEVSALRQRLAAAEQALAKQQPTDPDPDPPTWSADSPFLPVRPPATLDRAAIATGLAAVTPSVLSCNDGSYHGSISARLTVARDGRVSAVQLQPAGTSMGACIERALRGARFDKTTDGATIDHVFELAGAASRPATPCDVDALAEQGRDRYALGQIAAALSLFEQAFACRPDPVFAEKAFVAACNLTSAAQAARQWKRMTPAMRSRALSICVRNGITEDMLDEVYDAPGKLQVASASPAKVFVDGALVGTTPQLLELAAGRHTVKIQTSTTTYTHAIQVKSGETTTITKNQ